MVFNIADHIQKIKDKRKNIDPKKEQIIIILKKYIKNISYNNITVSHAKIFIKNISPTQKSFIKINKKKILKSLSKSDIIIHDII